MPLPKKALCGRNQSCPCGSTHKYKHCCLPRFWKAEERRESGQLSTGIESSFAPPRPRRAAARLTDTGEMPVRWVIADAGGTRLFADIQNRALVFSDRSTAHEIAGLHEFNDAEPGSINVAGVGPTKWALLQEKIAFVEVDKAEATRLVRERIQVQQSLPQPAEDAGTSV